MNHLPQCFPQPVEFQSQIFVALWILTNNDLKFKFLDNCTGILRQEQLPADRDLRLDRLRVKRAQRSFQICHTVRNLLVKGGTRLTENN